MNPSLMSVRDYGWLKKIIKKIKVRGEKKTETRNNIYLQEFDGNIRVRRGDDTLSRVKRIGETGAQLRHRIIIVFTSILYKFPLSHKKTFRARNVSR